MWEGSPEKQESGALEEYARSELPSAEELWRAWRGLRLLFWLLTIRRVAMGTRGGKALCMWISFWLPPCW